MNNEQDTQTNLPTSPDWSDAPEWAQWFAIDANGNGFWFSHEPRRSMKFVFWYNDFGYTQNVGKFDATNWENSPQPRPQQ